ncbi:hypothetical protein [Lewinella sp. 4G2]|uniref:hypothetical protein n=1 Tax=Lewinella sp. 4G2 TaxID=1803372 RepID=UPI0007B4CD6B|nr:hypothetical protein [Lewinella sp. 4G2]OAV44482.1 hypothetical protein A3850_008250 [Lewinella sp. 4G2]
MSSPKNANFKLIKWVTCLLLLVGLCELPAQDLSPNFVAKLLDQLQADKKISRGPEDTTMIYQLTFVPQYEIEDEVAAALVLAEANPPYTSDLLNGGAPILLKRSWFKDLDLHLLMIPVLIELNQHAFTHPVSRDGDIDQCEYIKKKLALGYTVCKPLVYYSWSGT